ncbi:MAG: hypothetical protein IJG68_03735 [Bacilli bacterium]|nr:hypothetical protein [Bacilli bacterium]
MEIDLSSLYSHTLEEIDISGDYNLPEEYYENSDIIRIEKLHVDGIIKEDDHINAKIEGVLILPDSISLEEVEYPFCIEYDDKIEENCKKGENILDIFQFLWENIVLEVPLQFTRVDDLSKFHGDGWKLISEDELKEQNNPFRDLLKDYDKE